MSRRESGVKSASRQDDRCLQGHDCFGAADEVRPAYDDPANWSLMRGAAEVEAKGHGNLTRIEELAAFSKKLPARRVGIAFRVAVSREADIVKQAFDQHGFEVHSACCKMCGLISLPTLWDSGLETVCSPIGQAFLLNHESTDLNSTAGISTGPDMLFAKHSAAPGTTLT
ncbi:MAG: DUF1847 domain-containing protein [Armatimonadota bacterium]|nr:MAG: DUF1847 domain-containing protein [Armatimonadota bacterium]